MAQDDDILFGRNKSGSQGRPRIDTHTGGRPVNAGLVRLGKMPGGSFTARMRKELSIAKLTEIHTATHPGARLQKRTVEDLEQET